MRYLNVLLVVAVMVAVQGCAGGRGTAIKVGANSTDVYSDAKQDLDNMIETKAMLRIREKFKDSAHVIVISYDRRVLIIGDVPNEGIKTDIEHILQSVLNVQEIKNELIVGPISGSNSRHADSNITNSIKSSLSKNKAIQAGVIKIATNRGVVYLVGLATHAEARVAKEIASTATNVQTVINGLRYIDN